MREPSDESKAELRRLFGEGGTLVTIMPTGRSPEELIAEIRRQEADAVFVDTVGPPYSRHLRALSSEFVVLEPMFEEEARYREGLAPRRVAGLGRRNERGELERVRVQAPRDEIERRRER